MSSEHPITAAYACLTFEAAQAALTAGVAAAKKIGVPMGLVAVDRAGHIVASSRMNGASAMTLDIAFKKAWTSAMASAPTAYILNFVSSDQGSAISMPHLANFSVIAGGVPVMVDGACVGAVGVSGATADLDLTVAEAAVSTLVA
ncbi:heme-binding protein [Novosphingobium sp. PASSN1]|uniref:GlcG/HbpS family heme-binding protein n=1 Tax=Novosphingobium sp. PASSN1 TaxID=2015561 RepID=UPI000BD2934B|nr:heme-binding protein [Novosphingobium sp. PASSN1]OYU34317.1 MAG: glycolate utilization protein [Novosphingobium sp. PASSN1]